jgi:predicted kinase
MTTSNILADFSAGKSVALDRIISAWQREIPLLGEFDRTPQDPLWHAEGSVKVHTEMVLHEMHKWLMARRPLAQPDEALALHLAALFHDIGKPLTTRLKEIDGGERIVSPRHAEEGRSSLSLRLPALGLSPAVELQVLALVGYHHHPRRLVQDDASPARWRQLARQCSPRLLTHLEEADLRGRICPDLDGQLEIMALFQLRCEELELWDVDPVAGDSPWEDWQLRIDHAFAQRSAAFRRHAFQAAVRDAEGGLIQSVEEGIARAYTLRDPAPELFILSGPSGSGKSEWIQRHYPEARVISLDALRHELAGRRADQSMNGQVIQAAKERLKAELRAPVTRDCPPIILDATYLRRELRASAVQLGIDYGARVSLIALRTPVAELMRRNLSRPNPVPRSVLDRQIEVFEYPTVDEAHEVRWTMDGLSRS